MRLTPRETILARVLAAMAAGVTCAVLFFAFNAFAQTATPAAAAPAESVSVAWLALGVAVLAAVLSWYRKVIEPKVDARLVAVAADTTKSKLERTAAQVALDFEPLVLSAAGHVSDDVAADGSDLHKLSTDAATDLVGTLDTALVSEASKYFGDAGGSLVNFFVGLIKNKVQATQAATVQAAAVAGATAAAAASATGAAAITAINKAV